jgi:hypothetical protein
LDQVWIALRPSRQPVDRSVSGVEPAGDLPEAEAFGLESLDFRQVQRPPWASTAFPVGWTRGTVRRIHRAAPALV